MTETNRTALSQEAKILEYWRRKYLFQAAAVAMIAGAAVAAAAVYVRAPLAALLLVLIVLTVAYLMLRELRESLQTRGEGLIFARGGTLFDGLRFDYGQGVDKDSPLFDAWKSDARECRGVMLGAGYVLEEDWLYNTVRARFFTLKLTVFEGMLLAVDCGGNAAAESADECGAGATVSAEVLARDAGVRAAGEKMRKLLGAESVRPVSGGNAVGFYFKTKKRLFHQFTLLRPNTTGAFVRRTEALQAQAEEVAAAVRAAAGADGRTAEAAAAVQRAAGISGSVTAVDAAGAGRAEKTENTAVDKG